MSLWTCVQTPLEYKIKKIIWKLVISKQLTFGQDDRAQMSIIFQVLVTALFLY